MTTRSRFQKAAHIALWVIPIAVLAGIAVAFFFTNNHFMSRENQDWSSDIRSKYGAEEVMYRNGFMHVTMDGKTHQCKLINADEVAAKKPIECSNNVVLKAN